MSVVVGVGVAAFYVGIIGVPSLAMSTFLVICFLSDAAKEAFRSRIIGEAAVLLLTIGVIVSTIAVPAILA